MKRLFRVSLFALAIVALLLPISAATAEAPAYREGIQVHMNEGYWPDQYVIDLRAVKLVDGDYRHSTVEFHFDNNMRSGRREIDTVFTVPIDADYLEVSEDLGWGGLDAVVWATMHTYDASGAVTASRVRLEFHLQLYYTAANSVYRDGFFYRSADVRGTVKIGDNIRTLSLNQANGVQCFPTATGDACFGHFDYGYNFSDQWPGL